MHSFDSVLSSITVFRRKKKRITKKEKFLLPFVLSFCYSLAFTLIRRVLLLLIRFDILRLTRNWALFVLNLQKMVTIMEFKWQVWLRAPFTVSNELSNRRFPLCSLLDFVVPPAKKQNKAKQKATCISALSPEKILNCLSGLFML